MGVQVAHENIMRWLYTLHLRAPGATVILVANKCDSSLADFEETTGRVERVVKHELDEWQKRRRSKDVTTVRLLDSVNRISCQSYGGIEKLKERIFKQDAASIQVPPAWDLALKVVEAQRTGGDPLHVARDHLELNQMGTTCNKRIKLVANTFTTKDQLSKLWHDIVGEVSGELEGARKAAVFNVDRALNGALWIR